MLLRIEKRKTPGKRGPDRKIAIFKCDICDKVFEKKRFDRELKYETHRCSRECYLEEKRREKEGYRVDFTCEWCGKVEKILPFDKRRFCSHKCHGAWTTAQSLDEYACEECGKTFTYTKAAKNKRRFCSLGCWYDHKSRTERKTTGCEQCGKEFEQINSGTQTFCSVECYASHRRDNPELYGCTVEDYQRLVNSPEAREKWQASMTKLWADWKSGERVHPFKDRHHTQTTKDLISRHHIETGCVSGEKNGMFGRNHTPEAREKMSIAHSKMIVNGGRNPYGKNNHRTGLYESRKGGKVSYRSSWERAFAVWCDNNDSIQRFDYEPFAISYWDTENAKRRYVPDFLVEYTTGAKILYEIKPAAFVNSRAAQLKAEAARKYCQENDIDAYEFMTKKTLVETGVLNG